MPSNRVAVSARQEPVRDVLDSVDSYLAEVLSAIRPLPPRHLDLDDADEAVLAEDVRARGPLPSFDSSAMDGFAVRASDVGAATPATPVTLPVRAEVAAGDTRPRELAAGTCARIMTGALLPAGADAVVRVEWTDDRGEHVTISRAVCPGTAVRSRGSDARTGQLLLTAGTRLGPAQLGLLAAAGRDTVLVRARPRLAILSAGNELAQPGRPLIPGQIWESNSVMLAAAGRRAGCVTRRYRVVRDDPDEVLAAILEAAAAADLVVTSGGVSMGGQHDSVKAALRNLGSVSFRKVAMQPGLPQGFGTIGHHGTPILTLPGNPVSAYVSFRLFAVPVVRALQGLAPRECRRRAFLTAPVKSPAGKRSIIAGVLDPDLGAVTPASGHSSHQLTALALANVLIIVPEQTTSLAAGDAVEVLELLSPEGAS